jgi:hypothetical protein
LHAELYFAVESTSVRADDLRGLHELV